MTEATYGITKNLGELDFEAAVEKVTEALKVEGFGVLTEIDVKATLKKKLDVDVRPYRILGACNPGFAHKALGEEPLIGLLMPCNVVVLTEEDGTITVSAVRPTSMFQSVDNDKVGPIACDVEGRLQAAIDAL